MKTENKIHDVFILYNQKILNFGDEVTVWKPNSYHIIKQTMIFL